MNQTIGGSPTPNNDDGKAASAPGIDVIDAAFHTGHDYPGGVPALAQRMGVNANTLQSKLDPRNTTHKLALKEAEAMMTFSGDFRILQAMAAAQGFVALSVGADTTGRTIGDVMATVKEFGEVLAAVNKAVEDGTVTMNEMLECERQSAELFAAVNTLLGNVRGMMTKAPS